LHSSTGIIRTFCHSSSTTKCSSLSLAALMG
jgi:hypothetical protein